MQMIYEHLSGGQGGDETLEMVYEELRAEGTAQDYEPGVADRAYVQTLLEGVIACLDEIDGKIRAASRNWSLDRMPKVDLTILRLGAWEILYEKDVPGSVAINEAVELAARYSDPESGRFINGVLGTILRGMKAEAGAAAAENEDNQ